MAGISASISLIDNMSKPLRSITACVGTLISAMENADKATSRGFDATKIENARRSLGAANAEISKIANNVQRNTVAQDSFNRSLTKGENAASGLLSKIKNMALTYMSLRGIGQVINLSDKMSQTSARLNMIVDDNGSVDELKKKIFAAAQDSRASYLQTADIVGKLGTQAGRAFNNNDELIAFSEQLSKNFAIAGTDATGIASAMYNLTQAMSSGVLRGQDFNAVISNAPQVIDKMAEYMKIPRERMREMAEQGKLSASVVKNALLSSAEETNAQFEKMPKTFAQVWTNVKNQALRAFEPILTKLNEIANSPKFQTFVNNAIGALQYLANAATVIFNGMISAVNFLADNWSILRPVILSVATALIIYRGAQLLANAAMMASKVATGIAAVIKGVLTVATAALTGATMAQTAAQTGLNAALYACPLSWILIAIMAIIAIIYAVIAAINKLTGKALSATGVISGAIATALAFVGNLFITFWNLVCDVFVLIYNLVATVANFIANVFKNPIAAVCRLFFGLADTVLGILQAIASAIDTIFGSNLSNAIQGWRNNLGGWVNKTFGKGDEIMKKMDSKSMHLQRFEYGKAYNSGYNFGKNLGGKISEFGKQGIAGGNVFKNDFDKSAAIANPNLQDIGKGVKSTAGNTGAIKDAVSTSKEDLKYLRDIAEREVINRFTTAKITVKQTNNNRIKSGMDIDGIVDSLTNKVNEAMEIAAEGVYS